jgi:hypothetical protein
VTLLAGAGAVTAFALRAWPVSRVLGLSGVLLTAGTTLTLAGVETHAVALAFAGTVAADPPSPRSGRWPESRLPAGAASCWPPPS